MQLDDSNKAAFQASSSRHHEVCIDLIQLEKNITSLIELMQPAKVCAVLKNDAYGHGLVPCAGVLAAAGIEDFGVVDNHEIAQLRYADNPRLRSARLWRIRPPLPWEREECIVRSWDVIEQVGTRDDLSWALSNSLKVKVALSLDCSMGRQGFGVPSHMNDLLAAVDKLSKEQIAGIMTHLANADGNEAALTKTSRDLDDFDSAIAQIKHCLDESVVLHVGNSAAGLRLERVRNNYDMVRCGASLFGETTSPMVPKPESLQPCLTWRTWIAQVREIPAGARIGYGSSYLATQKELVATLPIGYADGLKKSLGKGNGEVLIRGVHCPIRGHISSSSTVVGISHVSGPPLKPGEEVVLIGHQRGTFQGPDELAQAAGTGHLDIQTGIRAVRIYGCQTE